MKNLAKKTTLSVAALSMALNNMPTVHANVVGEELNDETISQAATEFQEMVTEIVEQNVSKEEAQAAYDKIMSSSQEVIEKLDDVNVNVSDIENKLKETLEGAQTKLEEGASKFEGIDAETIKSELEGKLTSDAEGVIKDAQAKLEEIFKTEGLEEFDFEKLPTMSEEEIKNFIDGKIDEELGNLNIGDIINGGKDAVDSITGVAGKVEDAKENFETSVEDFKNDMLDSKNELEGSIKDAYDSALEGVNGVIGDAHEGAMDSIEDLDNALDKVTGGMVEGSEAIEDKVEEIVGDIEETTEDIKNMDDNGVAEGADKLEEEVNASKEVSKEAVEQTNQAIKDVIAGLENVDSTEENAAKLEAEANQKAAEEAAKKAAELEAEAKELIANKGANESLVYDAELVEQLKALQSQAQSEAEKAQQAVQSANALVLNSQAEVNTIANKAAEAQAKVDALKKQLEERVTVTDKSGDLLALEAKLQAAKDELNGYKSEMDKAEADLEAAKVLALAAKTTAETANKALDATQEKLEEADAIVDKLAEAAIAKLEAEAAQATIDYNNAVNEAAEAQKAYDEAYAKWLEAGDAAITEAELLALSAAAKVSADLAVRYYDLMVEKQNELITENENAIQNNKDQMADKEAEFEEEKENIKAEMDKVLADKEAAKTEIEGLKQQTKDDEAFNQGKQDQIDANNTTISGLESTNTTLGSTNTELAKKNEELQDAIDAADELAGKAESYVTTNTADKTAHENFMNGENLMNSVVKTDEEGNTTVEHESLLDSNDTTTYTSETNIKFGYGEGEIKPTDATKVETTKTVVTYTRVQVGTEQKYVEEYTNYDNQIGEEKVILADGYYDLTKPTKYETKCFLGYCKEVPVEWEWVEELSYMKPIYEVIPAHYEDVPVYEYQAGEAVVTDETLSGLTLGLLGTTVDLESGLVGEAEYYPESYTVTTYGNATSYTDYVSNDMIRQSYVALANQLNSEAPTFSYVDANGVTVTTKYQVETTKVDEEGNTVNLTTAELEQAIIEYKNKMAAYGAIYGENSVISYWENYADNQDLIVIEKQNAITANNGTIAANNQTISNNQATINGLKDTNATLESEKVVVRDNSEAISELESLIAELDAKYSTTTKTEIGGYEIELPIPSGSLKDELGNVGSNDEEYTNLQEEQKELNKEWLVLQGELVALNAAHAGAEGLSEEADAAFQAKLEDAKAAAEVLLNATGTLTQEAMDAALAELKLAITEAKAIIAEDVKDVVVDVKENYDAQYEYVNGVVTDAAAKAEEASKIANAALQLVSKGENAALDSVQLMSVVDMALQKAQAEYDEAYASYQALLNTTYEVDPEVMAQLAEQIAKLSEIENSLKAAKDAANNAALEASGKAHKSAQNIQDMLCKNGEGLACKLNVTLKDSGVYAEEEANTTGIEGVSVEGSNLNALISHIQRKYANTISDANLPAANEGMMWSIQWNVAFLEDDGTWTVEYEYVQVNDPDYVPNVNLDGELPTPEVNYDEPAQPGEGEQPLPTPGVDYEEPTPETPEEGGNSGSGTITPSRPSYGGGSSSRPSTPEVEEEEGEEIIIEEEETAQGSAVITNPVIAAVKDVQLQTYLNALVQKEEIKQYSTFGLKTFDNSRVTGIKATSKGFTISGYMWIDGVTPTKDTWREIVLVNVDDMSTEFAYRKQTKAVDSSWLNNNKTATQDGKLDLTYAGYSLDVNYDDLNSYTDNKSGAKIKAGTYQMFMRISDGKDSFLFPLVDRVLSDGSSMESTNSLPEGFKVMTDEVRSLTVTIK